MGWLWTIFVLTIAVLVIAYILFYTISNAVGRAKVESQLAIMRTEGIPLDKEAILPKIPEKIFGYRANSREPFELNASENGAHFYKAAFELIEVSSSYNDLCNIQDKHQTYDVAKWSTQNRDIAQLLFKGKNLEMILNLFQQGAEKPYAIYERDYRELNKTLLPELKSMRAVFRLISIKASLDGINGIPEVGYSLISDGFKTIKQFESDPFLISQLVNIACTTLNINTMNSMVSRYGISRQNAEHLLSELNKLDFKVNMIHGLDGEFLIGRNVFETFIKEYKLGEDALKSEYKFMITVWSFFYQDYTYFLTQYTKGRKLYSYPYWSVEKEMKEMNDELSNIPTKYWISNLTLPLLTNPRTKVANIESDIDAAKLTLALHIYKNQNGAFPDKLEQLAPAILKEIPVDPISGRPFEYHKTDGTFELSSVWLKEKREEEEDRKEQEKRSRNKNGK